LTKSTFESHPDLLDISLLHGTRSDGHWDYLPVGVKVKLPMQVTNNFDIPLKAWVCKGLDIAGNSIASKINTHSDNLVAVMGDFATWKATQSGKGFDMKSFEVDMRPLDEIKDLRVGMSVLLVK